MKRRSAQWLRVRILGLLSENTRLARALAPSPPEPAHALGPEHYMDGGAPGG